MLEKFYDERSMNEISLPKDFNVLFSEWQARLGLSQISKTEEILEKRKKISEFYYNELKNFHQDVISQVVTARGNVIARSENPRHALGTGSAISQKRREVEIASLTRSLAMTETEFSDGLASLWSHYPVRIIGRDAKMVREKMKKKGIEVGVTFDYSLPELPIFKNYKNRDFSNSQKAAFEMLNLPNYPSLSGKDTAFIVQSLKDILKSI